MTIKDIEIDYYGDYREKLTVEEVMRFLKQLPSDMKLDIHGLELKPIDTLEECLEWEEDDEIAEEEYNDISNWCVGTW